MASTWPLLKDRVIAMGGTYDTLATPQTMAFNEY